MLSEQLNKFVTVKQYTSKEANGPVFHVELEHTGLNEHREFSSVEYPFVVNRVRLQLEEWEEKWRIRQGMQGQGTQRTEALPPDVQGKKLSEIEIQMNIQEAREQSLAAAEKVKEIHNILPQLLKEDLSLQWESLKDMQSFRTEPSKPDKPYLKEYPKEPDFRDEEYAPKRNWIDAVNPFESKKEDKAYKKFQVAYKRWREVCESIDKENEALQERYADQLSEWEKEVENYQAEKENFYREQQEKNALVDEFRQQYAQKHPEAVHEYCNMILQKVSYPETFPNDFTLDYNSHDQILRLEYAMPSVHDMPILKEIEYNVAKDELIKIYLDERQRASLYNTALYSMSLGVLHTLFETDQADALKAIYFNGWIATIDPESGSKEKECILSLHTTKEALMDMELSQEETEACFKQLGGVTHTQLSSLIPEAPIIEMPEEESAPADIEAGHELAEAQHEHKPAEPQREPEEEEVDGAINLATMEGEAFEQLMIDILEKEFNQHGGEVNFMSGSSEGEVYAIAFDPDPIRGGKMLIYGKKRAHRIGVMEARELYGNVMKEGASKGILITTSDFEPEAYDFAREKPVSLLDGTALLSLLEKHGYEFRIDLNAAGRLE